MDEHNPDENESTELQVTATEQPTVVEPVIVTAVAKVKSRFRPRLDFMFPVSLRNKLGKLSAPLAGLLLLAVLGGASALAYTQLRNKGPELEAVSRFSTLEVPFLLEASDPQVEASSVEPKSPFTFQFNKPVSLESFKANFFLSPELEGEFSHGETESDIVFTPKVPLDEGAMFTVKINGKLTSESGEQLGTDVVVPFSTKLNSESVTFDYDYQYSQLYSILPDKEITFSLYSGSDVDTTGTVSIYKSDAETLASSFIYDSRTQTQDDFTYTYDEFLKENLSVGGLAPIATQDGLANDSKLTFNQPVGVYALVAAKGNKQYGHAWVVVTDKGILIEQDDEKMILAARDLRDNSSAQGDVKVYGLRKTKQLLTSFAIDEKTKEAPFGYADNTDLIVGTIDEQTVVAPLSVLYSLARIRSDGSDFSTTYKASMMTEKPAYKVGDTVKMSGFIRMDNDAQYTLPANRSVKLYGQNNYVYGENRLFETTATIDDSGRFTAQTVSDASWVTEQELQEGAHQHSQGSQVEVYIDGPTDTDTLAGTFLFQKDPSSTSNLIVSFDKKDYLSNEVVTAKITGSKPDGSPLANVAIKYTVFSQAYYESEQDVPVYAEGVIIGDKDRTLTLDGNGSATVTVDAKQIASNTSQLITVQAKAVDNSNTEIAASGEALMHAGNGYIDFGIVRTQLVTGEEAITRFNTKRLDGQPLPNTDVRYEFSSSMYDNDSQEMVQKSLHSGIVKTDANGFAEIRQRIDVPSDVYSVTLDLYFADEQKNKVQGSIGFYVTDSVLRTTGSHEAEMLNFDISGSDGNATVGEKVSLRIDSPFATEALVSVARGRILSYETIAIQEGITDYEFLTDSLSAPSVSVWFTYFHEGKSFNEGVVINVKDPSRVLDVDVASSKPVYASAETPVLTVSTKDFAGAPVSTNLLVRVVDEHIHRSRTVSLKNSLLGNWNGYRETTITLSNSLLGIGGGGGGRCGGGHGGGEFEPIVERDGTGLYYNTSIKTDDSGNASIELPSVKGNWKVYIEAAAGTSTFGVDEMSFSVN